MKDNLEILKSLTEELTKPVEILLADDDKDIVTVFVSLLTELMPCVCYVESSWSGVRKSVKIKKYDLVWLDLKLMDEINRETLEDIKNHQPDTPIIICTGNQFSREMDLVSEILKVYVLLRKPILLNDIRSAMRLLRIHNLPCLDCPKLTAPYHART